MLRGRALPDPVTEALIDRLSPAQRECVARWLPGLAVVRDHSWGLVGTVVLEALADERRLVVKAFEDGNGHFAREVRAHREWLGPWTAAGRAPRLLHVDDDAKVLVTEFISGQLVQGSEAELEPDTYRQAGALLASLHGQLGVVDERYWVREQASALGWLDKTHRIEATVEARLRDIVESWPTPACLVVPTHGDWQPRNWVTHEKVVSAIDFGRAALRPAYTDFSRLSAQQFLQDGRLEEAFVDGYGSDPREPEGWQRQRLREAIGTVVWAHQVGDTDFEAQGHRMLAAALDDEGKMP